MKGSAPSHMLPDHVLVTASLILGRVAGKCNACVPVSATHMSHLAVHLRTTGSIIKELIRDGCENFWLERILSHSQMLHERPPDVAWVPTRCCMGAHQMLHGRPPVQSYIYMCMVVGLNIAKLPYGATSPRMSVAVMRGINVSLPMNPNRSVREPEPAWLA